MNIKCETVGELLSVLALYSKDAPIRTLTKKDYSGDRYYKAPIIEERLYDELLRHTNEVSDKKVLYIHA